MTDGFARRKEQSKEDIRKAAWELFRQFGIDKVSIIDIARKAGVSQATIYNNFGSKEGLAREFVTSMIDQLVNQVEEVLAPSQPFWEKMAAIIQFISAIMIQGKTNGNEEPAFIGSYNLLNDPEIKEIRELALEKMMSLLLGLVQEGKEQGQIQAEISENALRIYFKAFMEIFPDPQFRSLYLKDPMLVQNLGSLMMFGMNGPKKGDLPD